LISAVILFHLLSNFLFLKYERGIYLLSGAPHSHLTTYIAVALGMAPPSFEGYTLLHFFSVFLNKILGCSLLSFRLSSTLGFLLLLVAIYLLISLLFSSRIYGVVTATFVSCLPGNIFYSRIFAEPILFVAIIFITVYCIIKFYIYGDKFCFFFYLVFLYVGTQMFHKDVSFRMLYLLYLSGPLLFLLNFVRKKRCNFLRYFLLVMAFFIAWGNLGIHSYVISECRRFSYPTTVSGWGDFFYFYIGEILTGVGLIPSIIFIVSLIYLLFLAKEIKTLKGVNGVYFLGSLFIAFFVLLAVSKKQVFYVTPLFSLVGIFSAIGLVDLCKNKKKGLILFLTFGVLNLSLWCDSAVEPFWKKAYDMRTGNYFHFPYMYRVRSNKLEKSYLSSKKLIYQEIEREDNRIEYIYRELEQILAGRQEYNANVRSLSLLEYLFENHLCAKVKEYKSA